ncbi:peptidylprolyl isomerase [bacterium]|nr:peptidylprolyl isomerase [bacterium]
MSRQFFLILLSVLAFSCEETSKEISQTTEQTTQTNKLKEDVVVATVNGKEILKSRLYQELERNAFRIASPLDRNFVNSFGITILEELINEVIFKELFLKHGIEPDETVVKKNLDVLYTNHPAQNSLDEFLRIQGYTLVEYTEILKYETQVQILFDKFIRYNPEDFSDKSYLQYQKDYEPLEVEASQILFKIDDWGNFEKKREEAFQRAKEIAARARKGEDFNKLAKDFSEEQAGEPIGYLKWFPRGKMLRKFEGVVFALNIGEISEPIETQLGFHVVKLLGKRPQQILEKDLHTKFLAFKRDEYIKSYSKKLRDEAKIEIFKDKIYN